MVKDAQTVAYLRALVRTYEDISDISAAAQNRVQSFGITNPKHDDVIQRLESQKGNVARKIEKELDQWPVWTEWMQHIPGIGPRIGATLILLWGYRFVPVCQECGGKLEKQYDEDEGKNAFVCSECGKKAKGEGNLKHELELKDFPTVSKWWKYMGREVDEDGLKKRKKGEVSNWSATGRKIGFFFSESVNKQNASHPYKRFLLERKALHEIKHPEWTKGHRHNAAKHETVKLFLSHFWEVARTLEGKETHAAYVFTIMGHTNEIAPFYWDRETVSEAA